MMHALVNGARLLHMVGLENPWHIAILAIVLFLVFGSKRLPEIARSMGTGMIEFKRSIVHDDPPPPALTTSASEAVADHETQVGRRDIDTIA